MNPNERISQLEEVAAEMLHKQDIITADIAVLKGDVSAQRTAQLRTMQVVVGQTETITFILDKIDGVDAKVDALDAKVGGVDAKVDALETKMKGLATEVEKIQTQMDTYQKRTDTKLDLILNAIQGLGK